MKTITVVLSTPQEHLNHVRKAKGLSYQQIADLTGYSRQGVQKWFTQEVQPNFSTMMLVLDALEIDPVKFYQDWFLPH